MGKKEETKALERLKRMLILVRQYKPCGHFQSRPLFKATSRHLLYKQNMKEVKSLSFQLVHF